MTGSLASLAFPSVAQQFREGILAKSEPRKRGQILFAETQEEREEQKAAVEGGPAGLSKSLLNILDGPRTSVTRLAFESDPTLKNGYWQLYHMKMRLLPDVILLSGRY